MIIAESRNGINHKVIKIRANYYYKCNHAIGDIRHFKRLKEGVATCKNCLWWKE